MEENKESLQPQDAAGQEVSGIHMLTICSAFINYFGDKKCKTVG